MHRPGRILAGAARGWVRALLLLYPRPFRRRFGAGMLEAFGDRLEECAARGVLPVTLLLVRTTIDVTAASLREWVRPTVPYNGPFHDDNRATLTRGKPMDHLPVRGAFMSAGFREVRLAARALIRRPGFMAVALATIAIGIGLSATLFTIVNGVLLKPLPFAEPHRLVMIWSSRTDEAPTRTFVSQPDIESLRESWFVDAVEGVNPADVPFTGGDRPEQVPAAFVTGGLLQLLGVNPAAGRDLRHSDNQPDAPRVVVISHGFWQTRLGERPSVIGSSIQLHEEPYEIVGVAPPGFDYPNQSSLWIPLRLNTDQCGRGCPTYRGALARLADGVPLETAEVEVTAVAAKASVAFPDAEPLTKTSGSSRC